MTKRWWHQKKKSEDQKSHRIHPLRTNFMGIHPKFVEIFHSRSSVGINRNTHSHTADPIVRSVTESNTELSTEDPKTVT